MAASTINIENAETSDEEGLAEAGLGSGDDQGPTLGAEGIPNPDVHADAGNSITRRRITDKQTAPTGFPPNPDKDEKAQNELLQKLKNGALESIDQSLLPLSHLHHHDSRDEWAPFCDTCRAAKQRRKQGSETKFWR